MHCRSALSIVPCLPWLTPCTTIFVVTDILTVSTYILQGTSAWLVYLSVVGYVHLLVHLLWQCRAFNSSFPACDRLDAFASSLLYALVAFSSKPPTCVRHVPTAQSVLSSPLFPSTTPHPCFLRSKGASAPTCCKAMGPRARHAGISACPRVVPLRVLLHARA